MAAGRAADRLPVAEYRLRAGRQPHRRLGAHRGCARHGVRRCVRRGRDRQPVATVPQKGHGLAPGTGRRHRRRAGRRRLAAVARGLVLAPRRSGQRAAGPGQHRTVAKVRSRPAGTTPGAPPGNDGAAAGGGRSRPATGDPARNRAADLPGPAGSARLGSLARRGCATQHDHRHGRAAARPRQWPRPLHQQRDGL
ncbi:hypothetical protein G6F31_017387 [Rhizopus arrhizus]|nr:hypothetical protein G6F31_017387 [Rhizopus arrhizus]